MAYKLCLTMDFVIKTSLSSLEEEDIVGPFGNTRELNFGKERLPFSCTHRPAGHPDAKFLGFDDHSLATLAFAAGPP